MKYRGSFWQFYLSGVILRENMESSQDLFVSGKIDVVWYYLSFGWNILDVRCGFSLIDPFQFILSSYRIETSQLICTENQITSFCLTGTLALNF